jgi:hypothetical protein
MDLPGTTYLISLAVVSTTYVGFSALLVGLRQAKGSHLTSYDAYFTHSFIEIGFIVTVSGLVPSLLALYGWSPSVVWRLSSALAAIPILLFAATLPKRRRVATGMPVPVFVRILVSIQGASGMALVVTAALPSLAQAAAIYATALTLVLITSGLAYLIALRLIRPDVGPSG